MIFLPLDQGSPEWIGARLGRPTSSEFARLITPKTGKPSSAQDGYLNQLLAEWLTGEPQDDVQADFMLRGTSAEVEARRWYELLRDTDIAPGGFCLTDDQRAGASPDGFVGDDGLVEIKVPGAPMHVHYIRALTSEAKPVKYWPQIQGQLLVTGRAWVDFVSYHPTIKPVLVRYERDVEYLKVLGEILGAFCDALDAERERFLALGYEPALMEAA